MSVQKPHVWRVRMRQDSPPIGWMDEGYELDGRCQEVGL